MDVGEIGRVLEIYDGHLRSGDHDGERYEELDSSALLWRLKLLGEDTGDRWCVLADKWEPSATDTLYAFNDVHAMMAFVAADRDRRAGPAVGRDRALLRRGARRQRGDDARDRAAVLPRDQGFSRGGGRETASTGSCRCAT